MIVVNKQGALLADSSGAASDTGASYASRPEIARALAGRPSQGTRRSDSLDEDLLFTAVPVVVEGRRAGAVRVTQGVDAVRSEVRQDVIALVGVGVVALLLGLGVAWFLAGSLAKPLRNLAGAARRVTRGDLDARAEVQGSAEQQEVASAFNELTGRLSGTLRAQREFVANASHQLRTPLTGLRLRLEAAALKSRDPEVEHELTAAERETERLARLLSELLMLAGESERPSPQPVDLGEATSAACARWRGPAERSGHRLRLEEGEPAEVAASEEDVAAMLDNLLENALNYSPSGTEVTIGWREETGLVRIEIADQGPGIDEHEHERLFERFYRGEAGRAAAAGTGLGLSVVEALANRWTGRARLTNRHEGGALAELTLPAYRALPNLDPPLERALPGRG